MKNSALLGLLFSSCPAELDEFHGTPMVVTVTGEPGDMAATSTGLESAFPLSSYPHCSGCLSMVLAGAEVTDLQPSHLYLGKKGHPVSETGWSTRQCLPQPNPFIPAVPKCGVEF